MSLISSFILNSHLIHKMDSNKLSLPVKHHIWEFICLGKNWGFVGFFCHDQHWEPQLTDKCVSSERTGEVLMKTQNALWLVTASSCVCVCMWTWMCTLPRMSVQGAGHALLPSDQNRVLASSSCHHTISPLHQCQFPFLSLGLKRRDTCEAKCHHNFVSMCWIKKPSHPFQKNNQRVDFRVFAFLVSVWVRWFVCRSLKLKIKAG